MEWRWMTGWWWAGLAIVTLLLARSLHHIIGKICRPRLELRSGTLRNLNPTLKDAKFEIIAVPGLGAHPHHTWEARKTPGPSAAEYQTAESAKVHLLKDLLARDFPDARIWNFAHDSNWLIDAPAKTTAEIGRCLLMEIKTKRSHLPIIFIGHSLGGIIIKQALCSSGSEDIVDDTSGILFLGTPHQGSSVSVAGAMLAWMTGFLGSDTTLLLSLKSNDQQLSALTATFKQCIASLNERRQKNIRITSFYETKKTYLLGVSLGVVVSQDSVVIHDDAKQSHSIETDHSGLNKCGGPTDPLYAKLTNAIRYLKAPSPLEQADTWIRDKHYTADRLKIKRLSGELLSMDQCYINLAIVESSGLDSGRSKKKTETPGSPFSILDRQKVTPPDKTVQVELSEIFSKRKGMNGLPITPRRILIRGRAGVGKTTLCKKIVYEFSKGTWGKWNELFDRVLWVPLRNLKLPERRKKAKYTFEHLFSHEFLLPTNGQNLAVALSYTLDTTNKTLFLLDGLDEVSQDLTGNGSMACFLSELLNQPNVIITSRPSGKPPQNLHLELETVGFDPDQVNEYIEKSFTNRRTAKVDHNKVGNLRSFLQKHWLIQGLARIPIQLDALCYTWDDLKLDAMLNTMTDMYEEIGLKLWRKDILRLEKRHEYKELTEEHLATTGRRIIEGFVEDELTFIESLAFTGLYNDVVEFTSNDLNSISDQFSPNLLPDKTLPSISFLRTSDPSSEYRYQNYHFIHLTFQEYFAARYFTRRWKDQNAQLQLLTFNSRNMEIIASSPAAFLQKHKYTARYDIFWRFVAGLLDRDGQGPEFIKTLEEEPLDLLGPTHQRLVMHCLSETNLSTNRPIWEVLTQELARWLLFECKFNRSARLASAVEFPEVALQTALLDESSDVQERILRSLSSRGAIPRTIVEAVAAWLDDEDGDMRRAAVEALRGRAELPDVVLMAVAARLDDEDGYIRRAAVKVLGERAVLPDGVLTAMAARFHDWDSDVRSAAIEALGGRAELPDAVLVAVAARLDDEDWLVRRTAVLALSGRAKMPDEVLTAVAARLDDEDGYIRRAAVEALGERAVLPDEVLKAVAARLDDEDRDMPKAVVKALDRRTEPVESLMAIAVQLNDRDRDIRTAAVGALYRQVELPEEVLKVIATRLDDKNRDVREAAALALGGRAELPDKIIMAMAALLDDKDSHMQNAAINAVRGQAELPDKVLTAVAARLYNKHCDIRRAAVEALRGRAELPDKVLAAMAARLDDEDEDIRRAAVEALGGLAELPDEVLTAVSARLDDGDRFVRSAALNILMHKPESFSRTVSKGSYIASLYKTLLERSFREQLSWYITENNFYINMPGCIAEFPIDIQPNEAREWIKRARPADCPSIIRREMVEERKYPKDTTLMVPRTMGMTHLDHPSQSRQSINPKILIGEGQPQVEPMMDLEAVVFEWEIPAVFLREDCSWNLDRDNLRAELSNFVVLTGTSGSFEASTCTRYLDEQFGMAGRDAFNTIAEVLELVKCSGVRDEKNRFEITTYPVGEMPDLFQIASVSWFSLALNFQAATLPSNFISAVRWICEAVRVVPDTPNDSEHYSAFWKSASFECLKPKKADRTVVQAFSLAPLRRATNAELGRHCCWAKLFRSAIIAWKPLQHTWGAGLKLTYEMLVQLAAVENYALIEGSANWDWDGTRTTISDGLVAFGFFTALIPLAHDQTTNSIQWHLEITDDRIIDPEKLEATKKQWLRVDDSDIFVRSQCFLGWSEHINTYSWKPRKECQLGGEARLRDIIPIASSTK